MRTPARQRVKPIAIVLPQFHPIPENDVWWGNGFTEWTNVVKGRPRFREHYQPQLPKHLGYYDMRLQETLIAQADLARRHGVHGFCFYHYWFNGRRILETPVERILRSGEPEFPFMLAWANENWTRNWDGGFNKLLLEQKYSVDDFAAHARHLLPYFQDRRYIRIDNKPVFAIYKDSEITNLKGCIAAFRHELRLHGIEVFLCRFERRIGTNSNQSEAYEIFDAGIEFQPLTRRFDQIANRKESISAKFLSVTRNIQRVKRLLGRVPKPLDTVLQYRAVVENDLTHDFQAGWPIFPGACPGWDNSARRRDSSALIIHGSTPELFGSWITRKIEQTDWNFLPESFLFVNAWNEWAEGNHLEPCEKWGLQYLEALSQATEALVTPCPQSSASKLARNSKI